MKQASLQLFPGGGVMISVATQDKPAQTKYKWGLSKCVPVRDTCEKPEQYTEYIKVIRFLLGWNTATGQALCIKKISGCKNSVDDEFFITFLWFLLFSVSSWKSYCWMSASILCSDASSDLYLTQPVFGLTQQVSLKSHQLIQLFHTQKILCLS